MSAFFQTHRIRRQADFQHLREHGKQIHCGSFIIQAALRTERGLGSPRLAVITSRRVGGAVVRNRARRLMRELFRLHLGLLPPGLDLVVIMRASYRQETFQTLETRYRKACQRLQMDFSKDERGSE